MHKFSRTLLLAGVLAFGTLSAACGDKVTVAGPGSGTTGVQLVTVTPPSATIAVGDVIQLSGQVTADAASAKTVTWSTSNAAVATVDNAGKVTGVKAGSASITATSTADNTKAASSVVTVTGGGTGTPAVSISTINQGGTGNPAILTNVNGQLDITMNVTGGAGTVDVFLSPLANCGSNTIAATDQLVATQTTVSSQTGPVTLSFNTAQLVAASGQPRFINGQYCIKSRLTTASGTAIATTATPLTLNNVSTYAVAVKFTGPQAISSVNGLLYNSGDVTLTITPVNFTSATPLASISGTFAGRAFTSVTPAAGTQTFTVSLPGVTVPQGTAVPSLSLSGYTSPAAGDFVVISSSVTTAGDVGFTSAASVLGPYRVDNGSPLVPVTAQVNSTNGFAVPTSYINGAYTFVSGAGKLTALLDSLQAQGSGTDSVTATFGYALASSFGATGATPALTGNTNYGASFPAGTGIGATQCSQTGFTMVTSSSAIPNTTNNATYRARAFLKDKIGNVTCVDLIGPAGAPNANGAFGVDNQAPTVAVTGPADSTVQVAASSITTTFADSLSGFVLGQQVQYAINRNFSTANCVYGTTANGCTILDDGAIAIDNGTGTQGYYQVTARSVDQAGNFSTPVTRRYLIDNTAPVVQGISIPQNLVGGTSATFTSTATDNVDLAGASYDVLYGPPAGAFDLAYTGLSFGPTFDSTRVTTQAVSAVIPFFIQQLQTTTAGAPNAFVAPDSGEAASVTIRAVDAAGLVSAASTAPIPNINISGKAGYTTAQLTTFKDSTSNATLSNSTTTTTGTRSTTLVGQVMLNAAGAQAVTTPFSQVCFWYQQNAAGFAIDPSVAVGSYVQIGCVASPDITDVAGVSRTWTYRLAFDPSGNLGTAGTVQIIAIGVNSNGVGLVSSDATVANVALIP